MSTDSSCPAVTRGIEMLRIPMADLPPPAIVYAGYLCLKGGMCLEALLSAYSTYAQITEGLPCDDDLYLVTPSIRAEWDIAQRDYELTASTSDPETRRLRVRRKNQAPS